MSFPVKPRRRYDSAAARSRPRRGRWAMLQAARRLFLDQGYAATTMPAVAAAAGGVGAERLQGLREQARPAQGGLRRGHRR